MNIKLFTSESFTKIGTECSACDEAGILVWQDFMFGCALVSSLCHSKSQLRSQYPSYEKLNANIKDEAEKVVKRLRNHPSVVIFAGNNEDYQVAESMGVIDYSDESGDYMHSKFPAYVPSTLSNKADNQTTDLRGHFTRSCREIIEHLLPSIITLWWC